jgi:hypothetical protein
MGSSSPCEARRSPTDAGCLQGHCLTRVALSSRPRGRYAPAPKISAVRRGPQREGAFRFVPACPGWLCCPPDTSGGKEWSLTGGGQGHPLDQYDGGVVGEAAVLIFGDGPGDGGQACSGTASGCGHALRAQLPSKTTRFRWPEPGKPSSVRRWRARPAAGREHLVCPGPGYRGQCRRSGTFVAEVELAGSRVILIDGWEGALTCAMRPPS